ncbi:GTP 3',8-cyclase MoaA [Helicobacter pylori]
MLVDSFNRVIDYIRVSVTKQCNFSCQYCMPTTPLNFFDDEELLPLDNVLEFLKIAIDEGVKKIRITGGGVALSRVNVSLDSLKSDRVLKISQKDALKNTLEGIEESLKVGLKLKLNTVVVKSVNDDEILELYTLENGYQFGIIAPHSDDFCQSCNRIRLASDGKICPCLYYQDAIDAKEAIVNKDTKNIKRLLKQSVINKPEKNMWNDKNSETPTRAFYYTGG